MNHLHETFINLFLEASRNYRTQRAIVGPKRTLSYQELERDSRRLASHLISLGVKRGDRIGVCFSNSPEVLISIIAIMRAGAAFVPMDPHLPKQRLKLISSDSKPRFVLYGSDQYALARDLGAEIIHWEGHESTIEVAEDALPEISGADLAYVLYTSGSTGRPKGAMLHQAGLANYVSYCRDHFFRSGRGASGVPLFSTIGFDITLTSALAPLVAGDHIEIVPDSGKLDGLLGLLGRDEPYTFVKCTPSQLTVLNKRLSPPEMRCFSDVLILGGEQLRGETIRPWRENAPDTLVINHYGPTESTVGCCCYTVPAEESADRIPIGRPIPNIELRIVNEALKEVSPGKSGELLIGGVGVGFGYRNLEDLTAERFICDPANPERKIRFYRSGDRAYQREDGLIVFEGRNDMQVKVRGYRVELDEVENVLKELPGIDQALAFVREGLEGFSDIGAYLVSENGAQLSHSQLVRALAPLLPGYMIPSAFYSVVQLPLTPHGKLDRRPPSSEEARIHDEVTSVKSPRTEWERTIAQIWRQLLKVERVGIHQDFFEIGGNSLLLMSVFSELQAITTECISVPEMFELRTVAQLAERLERRKSPNKQRQLVDTVRVQAGSRSRGTQATGDPLDIAIVGMAVRLPGADSIEQFWLNLCQARESISRFSREELRAAGVSEKLISDPDYVAAAGIIENIELFAAEFFGFSPAEARVLDPQQRVFMTGCWQALQNAGYDSFQTSNRIGIFGGGGISYYYLNNILPNERLRNSMGDWALLLANDKDYMTTRVAHTLNLRGPAVTVQTACSTSLVAAHLACQSLRNFECDICLAGGIKIEVPQRAGYLHGAGEKPGSPDGHCRAFDSNAAGMVPGNGFGCLVFRRLEDAIKEGDTIYAVIKGSAINNDGADKLAWTAPSQKGQAETISAALQQSGFHPDEIGYVEAHGTGTTLGDPIEVAGLTSAFRKYTERKQYCGLGSVKTNIGHLQRGAGIVGLMKAALCVCHGKIPPTLHFREENPHVALSDSPFFVNNTLTDFPEIGTIRRAGVSSFGIGGTNAHMVIEQYQQPGFRQRGAKHPYYLIPISADSQEHLEQLSEELSDATGELAIADVAKTLGMGRTRFSNRKVLVATPGDELRALLKSGKYPQIQMSRHGKTNPPVVFLFPGGGAQHRSMVVELYQAEPTFRRHFERCADVLLKTHEIDLRKIVESESSGSVDLSNLEVGLPALFAVEYALAHWWYSIGIEPVAMIGHSLGENVAACLSGVVSLDDVLPLVASRGRIFKQLPEGRMLSVALCSEAISAFISDEVSLAAINGPGLCVLSGNPDAINSVAQQLECEEIEYKEVRINRAAHSCMLDSVLPEFRRLLERVSWGEPTIPYVGNVTGEWIDFGEQLCTEYWVKHLRQTVQFDRCVKTVRERYPDAVFLEIGPGTTLSSFVRMQNASVLVSALSSLPHPKESTPALERLYQTAGKLWLEGAELDWSGFSYHRSAKRIPLPVAKLTEERYWVEAPCKNPELDRDQECLEQLDSLSEEQAEVVAQVQKIEQAVCLKSNSELVLTDTQLVVQTLWRDLLGVEDILLEANFFELGGHSLLATRMVRRLRELFHVDISLTVIFEHPTVAGLSLRLDELIAEQQGIQRVS